MKNNNFEKLNNGVWKKIVIGSTCLVAVLSVGILATSKAKYKLTESINIVNGTVNYKVPDLKVMAIYTSEDGTNYTETATMPESGYVINEEKTYCTTDNINQVKGKIKTENGKVTLQSLAKGDKCYIYFDKRKTINDIIATLNPKTTTPTFSNAATTDEGVYKISDGMYGGDSYYWRGAATTNYVKFANFCWRIIRINGDKTMRIIYDGATCHANGTNTAESIAVASQAYNSSYNRSEYVGYTYKVGSQRPSDNATGTESNLKTQTDNWYNKYIAGTANDSAAGLKEKGYDAKVATGKFCNDRNTASGSTWSSQPSSTFSYVARERLETNKTPTLSCSNSSDVYSLKVGAITADEVTFAGGIYGTANSNYYLFNGQFYWTMSPYVWDYINSSILFVRVFILYYDGQLSNMGGYYTYGLRPVINLRSDITFSSGDGTLNNPYTVAN